MADITAQEITEIIKASARGLTRGLEVDQVGTVALCRRRHRTVWGLEKVMSGELLEFPNGSTASP